MINIFIHIPRTGGTTFRNIIRKNYEADQIVRYRPKKSDKLEKVVQSVRDSGHSEDIWIMGHFGYGLHHFVKKDVQTRYFVILRDPVERIISLYYYILTKPDHAWYKKGFSSSMDLRSVVDAKWMNNLHNFQSKALASDDGNILSVTDEPEVGNSILNKAIDNLEKIEFKGITEQYENFLLYCKDKDVFDDISFVKQKVTNHKPLTGQIEKKTIDLIRQKNSLDLALYRYIKERISAYY